MVVNTLNETITSVMISESLAFLHYRYTFLNSNVHILFCWILLTNVLIVSFLNLLIMTISQIVRFILSTGDILNFLPKLQVYIQAHDGRSLNYTIT